MTAADDPTAVALLVTRHAGVLHEDGPHRVPRPDEVALAAPLATALGTPDGDPAAAAAPLGLVAHRVGGRVVLLPDHADDRSWLVLVARPDVAPTVLVEVPHPAADLRTEFAGLEVLRRLPTALLLQAGAHRRAGAPAGTSRREDFPADVAARPDSVYALVADGLVADLGLPQVQLHGFADRGPAGPDVVVSPGAARPGPLLAAVTGHLAATGERVARGDDPGCTDLAGTRNVQGRSAARHGAEFVHVEMSRSLRRDARRRDVVAGAVAAAVAAVVPSGERSGQRSGQRCCGSER